MIMTYLNNPERFPDDAQETLTSPWSPRSATGSRAPQRGGHRSPARARRSTESDLPSTRRMFAWARRSAGTPLLRRFPRRAIATRFTRLAVYAMGILSAFWCFERIAVWLG